MKKHKVTVAYCAYHNNRLSIERIEFKSCTLKSNIGTKCPYLWPDVNHPYWVDRDTHGYKKKLKKKQQQRRRR